MEAKKRVPISIDSDDCVAIFKNSHSEKSRVEHFYSDFHTVHPLKRIIGLLQFLFVIVSALFSALNTFAQLPNLGTASSFAVFTTIGALDNAGVSNITGNIGTNDGDTSGFGAPTIVNGNIEWVNAATAQCAIDVQTAYNEIFAIAPTVVGHAPTFGGGETLPAGVYFIGAAGSIAGNLTLDAAGVPNAIFIFQFGGAFTTAGSSKVNLINGAEACNVFWIAEGAISMVALTEMKGTLISNNGAISLGAGGTLDGRMLSTAGAAYVYDALITLPVCVNLPITMLSFAGECEQRNIVLRWSTATEKNNSYFTIEGSQDLKTWNIVGTVLGAGNSATPHNYTLKDMAPFTGTNYYRLKQTDYNGDYAYEGTIGVNNCDVSGVDDYTIYPNPTDGKFELFFKGHINEINSIAVVNAQGTIIYYSTNIPSAFDLSNHDPGFYFVRIQKISEIISLKLILSN